MAPDEIIDEVELEIESQDEQDTPPETSLTEQERKTWEGRLRKEQERFETIKANLAQYNATVDEFGNIVPIQQQGDYYPTTGEYQQLYQQPYQQPYQQQYTPPDDEEFDPYVPENIDKRVTSTVAPVVNGMMSAQDWLIEQELKRQNPDWGEIGGEVKNYIRSLGATGFSQVISMNRADLIDMAIFAARGKRGQARAAGDREKQEAERQAAISAAAATGGAPSAGAAGDGYDYTPEEREAIAAAGMTVAEYEELTNGRAELK
mgnify:CR=1 FL=1